MQTAEKFIDTFTKIEHHFKTILNIQEYLPLGDLLFKAAEKYPHIRFYKDHLYAFSSLRNAIVHSPRKEDKPIADPRQDILLQIEDIYHKISAPKLVYALSSVRYSQLRGQHHWLRY